MLHSFFLVFLFLSSISRAYASPTISSVDLERRTDPVFPSSPASCPICQQVSICFTHGLKVLQESFTFNSWSQNYASISSCAQAVPVLANISMIIFNPGSFIDVIKCACGDTFQSVFPQCVDCFIQTGQQDVLNVPDLPGLVNNTRQICGLESTLLGNVSGANSAPTPTSTSGNVLRTGVQTTALAATVLMIGVALAL